MTTPRKEYPEGQDRVQAYLDGTLSKREAMQLFLQAKRDPELRAELELYRELYDALDRQPVEQPSATFDDRILRSLPLEQLRSAPRRPERVLVIGDASPSLARRMLRPLRSSLAAMAAAYVLFLAVSHSFLAGAAASAAQRMGDGLASLAARTQDVPVLSSVVGLIADVYSSTVGLLSLVGEAIGPGLLTFVLGLLVGAGFLIAVASGRRHRERRTRA